MSWVSLLFLLPFLCGNVLPIEGSSLVCEEVHHEISALQKTGEEGERILKKECSRTPKVELGIDVFLKRKLYLELENKRVGLITNQTGVNGQLRSTVDLLREKNEVSLVALFCPEHGLDGSSLAGESVSQGKVGDIPVYSLHGETKRPTDKMLKGIDILLFDLQDIGCRSYTFVSTLFYVMEEAAKRNISVIVLDRPNPMNGLTVDGPMLHPPFRSFVGYINVPYCHGLTIGELALFFNKEYEIRCDLRIIPMEGWKRSMTFRDTGLEWIPTSPYIPEADSPFFYASTGILGELELVNIGIGYTLPFKVVGAPWVKSARFAEELNKQKLPGVIFFPFAFRPFYGPYTGKKCQGVKIVITDPLQYRPLAVQYLLLGMLKTLYPTQVKDKLSSLSAEKKKFFSMVNGTEKILDCLCTEQYVAWKLIQCDEEERKNFMETRKKYFLY